MNGAVTSGLLTRVNTPSDVTGDCVSERYDWEPYWTLAICPTVEDVTLGITSANPGTVEGIPMIGPTLSNSTFMTLAIASDPTYRQMVGIALSNLTIEQRGTISDSLLLWYPPCTPNWYQSHKDQQYWRAHRAKLNLCLQRLNSSFYNSSMHTEVIESKVDVAWRAESVVNSTSSDICGDSPDATHCVSDQFLASWAFNLFEILNQTASTAPGGDNYYDTNWIRTFVTDIMGANPTACSEDASLGLPAFQRRMQNIASAMSNT